MLECGVRGLWKHKRELQVSCDSTGYLLRLKNIKLLRILVATRIHTHTGHPHFERYVQHFNITTVHSNCKLDFYQHEYCKFQRLKSKHCPPQKQI